MSVTRATVEKELELLKKKVEKAWRKHEKEPDHGDGPFICPGVGVIGTCTSTAVYLAAKLGGEVYGYSIEDNPEAIVGQSEFGHDFAVIDERYLADFWAYDTYQHPWLYDLKNPKEFREVVRMYGDPKNWTKMAPNNFNYWKSDLKSYT